MSTVQAAAEKVVFSPSLTRRGSGVEGPGVEGPGAEGPGAQRTEDPDPEPTPLWF